MKLPQFYICIGDDHRVIKADVIAWGRWCENGNNIVAKDDVGGVHISTVFLGIDHRHYGKGPPVLFETMIFGGGFDGHMWLYTTWDDAETGHAMAVKKVRARHEQHC